MQAVTAMEVAEKAEEFASGKQNRRAVPRFEVDEDARLQLVAHGSAVSCRMVDLSLKGCRIRTKERFPVGAMVRVEVTFKVRGLAFRFSGVTQWTDGHNIAGIRFVDVPARRKEELVEALLEVEAENAAKAARKAVEKRAAEEQAAAKLAAEKRSAEEQAAARKAAAALVAEQAKQEVRRHSLVQALNAGRAAAGLDGPLAGPSPAEPRPKVQRPASPSPVSPQPPVPQKEEAPPASSPPKPSKRERRTQSREEVDTSAVIHLINIASRLQGRILDLSLNGCRIRTNERFPVGIYTRVETEFRLEGLPFRLGGVIQAIHDRNTVGIRFLDMSERRRAQVEQLIAEIQELKEARKVKSLISEPGPPGENPGNHPSEHKSLAGDPGEK
jgi:c-di-GMP-binding flagellar brake protein YcgR